jgi:hypothetical protein
LALAFLNSAWCALSFNLEDASRQIKPVVSAVFKSQQSMLAFLCDPLMVLFVLLKTVGFHIDLGTVVFSIIRSENLNNWRKSKIQVVSGYLTLNTKFVLCVTTLERNSYVIWGTNEFCAS